MQRGGVDVVHAELDRVTQHADRPVAVARRAEAEGASARAGRPGRQRDDHADRPAHQPGTAEKAAEQAELERLRKKVARLEKDLAKRDAALEITGNASALLELLAESAD